MAAWQYNPLTATLVGMSGSVALDHYGRLYLGGGVSVGRTFLVGSASLTAGYLIQGDVPSPTDLRSFLTGPSVSVGGGFVGGADVTYSPAATGSPVALEVGLFTPQIGVTAGFSEQVYQFDSFPMPQ